MTPFAFAASIAVFLALSAAVVAQFSWQTRDSFDDIQARVDAVTKDNCDFLHLSELFLPDDAVSHKPDIKEININPTFPNRTALLYLHNLALSRGFYFSYILQKAPDAEEPGLMYHYLSVISDVTSSPRLNASATYFAPNSSYTPSYKGFFNKTMPLFAPRAFRADDYNDPIHLERVSTLNTIVATDLGAFPPERRSLNYSTEEYRINEGFRKWLPDVIKGRQDTKTTYILRIRHANNTNVTTTFHGPPGPDETPGPVKWVRPYFDCGRSNKFIFGASVPIADIYPRHTQFRHIEFPTYTAVSVLELDFDRIDINQCPLGEGNPGPNVFAGTDYCKKDTTECEPLHGYGFRRGGYQCRCNPGFRLPNMVRRPYLGQILERATKAEYDSGFHCVPIGFIMSLLLEWGEMEPGLRQKYMDKYEVDPFIFNTRHNDSFPYFTREDRRNRNVSTYNTNYNTNPFNSPNFGTRFQQSTPNYGAGGVFNNPTLSPLGPLNPYDGSQVFGSDYEEHYRLNGRDDKLSSVEYVQKIMSFVSTVRPDNCHLWKEEDLVLGGDVAFGVEEQFENEARMALRLAHFLSSFLQVVDPKEIFAEFRVADKPLTKDQVIGEVASLLMGDYRIQRAGVFWDRDAFPGLERGEAMFAPVAYRTAASRSYQVEDMARLKDYHEQYLNKPWFKDLKSRWATNVEELEEYFLKIQIRKNREGHRTRAYEHYPIKVRLPRLKDGWWSRPFFDCKGFNKHWLVTYAAPFFGWDSLRHRVEFKGVVTVSMDMKHLDVNQCDMEYFTSNAFKDSHKCDRENSYCVPILGRGFDTGGYKCECVQGYEYPFQDLITYFDGQLVEAEFENLVKNKPTRFDTLKCRLAGASQVVSLGFTKLLIIVSAVFLLWRRN